MRDKHEYFASKMRLTPPPTVISAAAVCSKEVVLLIRCLLLLPFVAWVWYWSVFCYAVLSDLSSFSIIFNQFAGVKRAGCFTLIVFLMSCPLAVSVLRLFPTVSWVILQFLILLLSGHTHLLLDQILRVYR